GAGALTGELARRAGRVVALEIDRELVEGLRARVPSIEVIEADARVWDYGALARPRDGRVLVVGNLPYSVGKPILAALIAARPAPVVPLADERRVHAVVRAAFAQRRKTLANALAAGLGLPLEVVRATARTAGVDPGRRAETLTILEFAELARRL